KGECLIPWLEGAWTPPCCTRLGVYLFQQLSHPFQEFLRKPTVVEAASLHEAFDSLVPCSFTVVQSRHGARAVREARPPGPLLPGVDVGQKGLHLVTPLQVNGLVVHRGSP